MDLTAYFARYHANTLAGSGNQSWFSLAGERTGRVFYQVFAGGEYRWSPLFSDAIFTTYADGAHSRAGMTLGRWRVCSARIGVTRRAEKTGFAEPAALHPLAFGGAPGYQPQPGEAFFADPVSLRAESGDYICLEVTICGERIPFHPETLLPCFVKTASGWAPSAETLFAAMLGCDRPARLRVGFLGDSITQGCGTTPNAYAHWTACLARRLPADCAYWNLGLGYARASDAAGDGEWLRLARQNDAVFLCLGTNDICRGYPVDAIRKSLAGIVGKLRAAGVSVLLQSLPPFDYAGERRETWFAVNNWLKSDLSRQTDAFFDCVPVLSQGPDAPWASRFGAHPDDTGCARWAEALLPTARAFLEGRG